MKVLAYSVVIVLLILGGYCLYHYLQLLINKINTRESGFYQDHFMFFCTAPSAIYIATLIAAIAGFLETNSEEIVILGYKTRKGPGIILIWMMIFIVIVFGFKFLW